jgi:hypothetical protein
LSPSSGFAHSAFTFAYESLVIKSSTAQTEIPPGALITFLQKGLEYIAIEEHINEVQTSLSFLADMPHKLTQTTTILQDGTIEDFDNNFSLLSPLICEAVAVKEDRRARRTTPAPPAAKEGEGKSSSGAGDSKPMEEDGVVTKSGDKADGKASGFTPSSLKLV